MSIPLSDEIDEALKELGIEFVPLEVMDACVEARNQFQPSTQGKRVSASTFWDLSELNRYDLLTQDIPRVSRQLAYSAAMASIYLRHIQYTYPVQRNRADHLFWYHVDFGVRLASSGWDRLALFLDLAFKLGLQDRCNLGGALARLSGDSAVVNNRFFKELKKFRDGAFQELEAKRGEGARHEATHILSPSIREFFECFEEMGPAGNAPSTDRATARLRLLTEHHGHLRRGIENVVELVGWRFSAAKTN